MYGFDATRTGAVPLALRPPFRKVWTSYAGSLVEFPPSIGYGRLYFSTNAGRFTAINLKTGKPAWTYEAHRCVAASPAIGTRQRGTVYAAFLNHPPCNAASGGHGADGQVIAFCRRLGKDPLEDDDRSVGELTAADRRPPLRRRLETATSGHSTRAPAGSSGAKPPHRRRREGAASPVRVAGSTFGSYDGHVYCLSVHGKLLWRASAQPRLYREHLLLLDAGGRIRTVYIGSTDGKIYSFGATTGKLRWSHSTGGYVYASPAVWNGLVLAGSYDHRFYALDAATGEVRWRFDAHGQISGSATVIGNVVYVATLARHTYALDARTGRELWSFPDGQYTPAVAVPGRLFLVGYGKLYGMVPR